ncbi:MAG: DUF4252 domain-containing protein [Bacteroidales bacterium]|nr:DUF4252 domain-containing protein [Bacteroidales bacterium]
MKKTIFVFAVIAWVSTSGIALAQNTTNNMFKKYGSGDGFTVVSINKDLFTLLLEIGQETDAQEISEVQEVIKGLETIKILMYDANKGTDPSFLPKFKEELDAMKLNEYSELMMVREQDDIVRFMIRKDGEIINELLLLISQPDEAGFVSITGNINIKSIAKISRTMNIQGLENLEKINQKEE